MSKLIENLIKCLFIYCNIMLNNNSAKLNEGKEIDQTCKIIIIIIKIIIYYS